ncbi:MAG: hypothetical protein QOK21_3851 [Solirubrobacteraceae bacterium]|nr:hypothetical protein [Solirubrobacteraceae bacterium]
MVGGDLEAVAVDVPVDANLQVDAPRLVVAVEAEVELVEDVQRRRLHRASGYLPTNADSPVIARPTISELISRVPS